MLKSKVYTEKSRQDFYDLALLLAHGQSHDSEDQWGDFIDHLSRICDEFAKQTDPDVEIRTIPTTYPSQLPTATPIMEPRALVGDVLV